MWWQATCVVDNKVTVSNESTLTVSSGSLRDPTSRASSGSKFHGNEAGTLAQVVSKYVSIENGAPNGVPNNASLRAVPSNSVDNNDKLVDPSQCFLSTQVPYSEDSSTSSVSPSGDTATSPDSWFQLPAPSTDSFVPAGGKMHQLCNATTNPDNLQSMLPPSFCSGMHINQYHRGDWTLHEICNLDVESIRPLNTWNGATCGAPSESWSNLCELPAAWQYYTDPGMVANEMEHELVDVKRELAMRSYNCEEAGSSSAWLTFQDDGCDACFSSDDWRFPHSVDADNSSVSCLSDLGDDYLCNDVVRYPSSMYDEHQVFPVYVMEEPMGCYEIPGL